jgi:hypothetical protein
MRKKRRLNDLYNKVSLKRERIKELVTNLYGGDKDKIDFDVYNEIQSLRNDVHTLNKKIEYLQCGKGVLGVPFSAIKRK